MVVEEAVFLECCVEEAFISRPTSFKDFFDDIRLRREPEMSFPRRPSLPLRRFGNRGFSSTSFTGGKGKVIGELFAVEGSGLNELPCLLV
jgi:hypothetical protein